jgi:hypothetical protein
VSGSGNGTFSAAALTGVTSVTAPAATNLTLAGGTAGTSSVVVSNTTAATTTTSGALRVGSNVGLSGNSGGASYFGGAVTFAGAVTTGGTLTLPKAPAAGNRYILTGADATGTGQLVVQAGGGSASWGGTLNLFETAHATKGGWVGVGLGVTGAKFTINSVGFSDSGEVASIDRTGAATFAGIIKPQQATTAGAPAYVKGAIYFDTTLNKLRVGGATAWETITSV